MSRRAHPGKDIKILIGICSCCGYYERRAAVRRTWLCRLPKGVQAIFFVGVAGNGPEMDVISLPVPDDYKSLPRKIQAFFNHALAQYDFDYLFKCDDDTYARAEGLLEIAAGKPDFVGSSELAGLGYAGGGAGYLLSRRVVQSLAKYPCPERAPEDMWVSFATQAAGYKFRKTPLLRGHYRAFSDPTKKWVTLHQCSPEVLDAVHLTLTKPTLNRIASYYYSRKSDSHGPVYLLQNGIFIAERGAKHGTWKLTNRGSTLSLGWFGSRAETLKRQSFGFANGSRRLDLLGIRARNGKWQSGGLQIGKLYMGVNKPARDDWLCFKSSTVLREGKTFPPASFQTIVVDNLIQQLSAPEALQLFRETHRALKPGGTLRTIFPCVTAMFEQNQTRKGCAASTIQRKQARGRREQPILELLSDIGVKTLWTEVLLRGLLGAVGFRFVDSTSRRNSDLSAQLAIEAIK